MKTRSTTNWLLRTTLAFCTAVGLLAASRAAMADSKVYQEGLKSTVWVLAKNSDGTSSGTGALVDLAQKLVMTNYHVVGDARAAVIFFPEMEGEKPNVTRQ